jgi:hypothetical protein
MMFLSAAIDHFRYLNFEQSAGSAQRGASDIYWDMHYGRLFSYIFYANL